MKYILLLLFTYSHLFGGMSVEEAWSDFLKNSDGLKASQNELKIAKLKKSSAKSMYLPSVNLVGSYTHLSEPVTMNIEELSQVANGLLVAVGATPVVPSEVEFSKDDVFLADLQLLWPLYTGGKIDAAQDIYGAKVDEADAKEQMKKDEEFLKLIKYYYGVVLASSLYKTRQDAQDALELHYKNSQKLKDEGQIAKVELLNAKVKFDAAKIETTKAKHKLEIALSALQSLTKSQESPISKLFISQNLEDENHYKDKMRKAYAPLSLLDAKAKQSSAFVDVKKADFYPTLVAFGDYNLYKDDSPLMESIPEWYAGVVLSISLIKREDRLEEIEAAKLTNARVKHLKAEAVDKLLVLVEKSYKEMMASLEEFNSLSSSLDLANENYRLRLLSFKEGLSTSVEVVDAELFLESVKTKRLNAAYNFVQKLSQLNVLAGDREMFFKIAKVSKEIE